MDRKTGNGSITITGGDRWKEALKAVEKAMLGLRVGIPEGATNPAGESVAAYAFFNEVGAAGIPRRPFMHITFQEKNKAWAEQLAHGVKGNEGNPQALFNAVKGLGLQMGGDILGTIDNHKWPPNSPATLARKNPGGDPGKNKPLVDQGWLKHFVTYIVEQDGSEVFRQRIGE